MRPTELLQKIRKMRFKEAYEGWQSRRLTQMEAARLLGVCDRSFRRYLLRYEEDDLEGLIDRRFRMVFDPLPRRALRRLQWRCEHPRTAR